MLFFLKGYLAVVFFLILGSLTGCAFVVPQSMELNQQPPKDLTPKVELEEVPFFAQEEYQCGPAALAMILNSAGVEVTPESLVEQVYIPARKGSLQVEMLASIRRNGLLAYELEPKLTDVLREISAGTPVIVLENYNYGLWPVWHYAVAIGYDLEEKEIIRRSGSHRRETMPFIAFEYLWKTEGYWAMIAMPLDQIPASASEKKYAHAVLALEESGYTKNAQIAYGTLLNRWPKNLIGQMGLGNTAYALNDLEGAKSAFLLASQDYPESAAAHNNLAFVLAELGQIDEAIIAANRSVNIGGPLLDQSKATLKNIELKAIDRGI